MNLKNLIQNLTTQLKGHNALIQIQVDGQYIVKRVGDVNKLMDNPTMTLYKQESSFLEWMDEEIKKETFTPGTISNHKATLGVLRRFRTRITFSDIDYKCICDFENFLKVVQEFARINMLNLPVLLQQPNNDIANDCK